MPARHTDYDLFRTFTVALTHTDPAGRARYLDHACSGDDALRTRVEELLVAHARAGGRFETDAGAPDSAPSRSATATGVFTPNDLPGEVSATAEYRTDGATGSSRLGITSALEPRSHSSADSNGDALGTVLAGRYTLVSVIGEGGMGAVYLAEQTAPVCRQVAIKLIRAGLDSRAVLARFEAERQALAVMDHPNVARIYDGGATDSGQPFIAMELIRGVPLTNYCDQNRLPVRARLELFVAVCHAVQHAHQKGLIHRDLKPGNVLVTEVDGRAAPKVIDFGVAKATGQLLADPKFADTGAIVGTPAYMSPEQTDPDAPDVDTRTDVYALGVILYELLVGAAPLDCDSFGRGSLLEMLRAVREVEPPRPSTKLDTTDSRTRVAADRDIEPARLAKLLRSELDWVVMRAMEKDRTRRYSTALELAQDVQRYLADEPIAARPPSRAYRFRKFVKRNKGPVTGAALLLLALAGGGVGTGIGLVRAEQRRAEAETSRAEEARQRAEAVRAGAAERAANEQTQRRLAQIEKGMGLFAGMLAGINPRAEATGGDPVYAQLRQRAEQAADALDAEAVGDRLVVANLQSILGNTLRELGGHAKAAEVLEKARATRARELGADHPATLTSLHDLALVFLADGKPSDAVPRFEEAYDGFVKALGADHEEALNALNSLANAYRVAGKRSEAIARFEQVRASRVRLLGADHPATLTTLNGLAGAYQEVGKLPEAIALFEQVRAARVRTLGANHPAALVTANNLAEAYRLAGKLSDATVLFELVCNGFREKLGADHPSTLTALHNLAGTYLAAERLPEAIALFEQAATGVAKGRFQHAHSARIIPGTIAAYERAARFDKAEGWLRQWLTIVRQRAGADSPAYADELAGLGQVLLKQEKWADAEPYLRECLAIREKKAPDAWNTFNTRSQLGGSLLGQKKYAAAEPLLRTGYEGLKARERAIPPQAGARVPEAIARLIELYTATNNFEEASKWRSEMRGGTPGAPGSEKK